MAQPAPDGGLYIKFDERPHRMVITQDSEKRYVASGWELPGKAAFEAALARLDEAKVGWELGDEYLLWSEVLGPLAEDLTAMILDN